MDFSPFVVVAGTNASGKSNLFDAIRLLSALAESDLPAAFANQRGAYLELFTQYSADEIASRIHFAVEFYLDRTIEDDYNRKVELVHRRMRYEVEIQRVNDERLGIEKLVVNFESLLPIERDQDKWFKSVIANTKWETVSQNLDYKPYIVTEAKDGTTVITLRKEGKGADKLTPISDLARTVLSGVNDASFPHSFAVRHEMQNWNILQLNPTELSRPSLMLGHDFLNSEGQNLAALINRIGSIEPMAIKSMSRMVHRILPDITEIYIHLDQARRQYVLMAKGRDGRSFSSSVLSEGTLRIIALIALIHDERHRGLICFEEPENGIHPLRMKQIIKLLQSLSTSFERQDDLELPLRQVLINTHSPLLIKEVMKLDGNNDLMYFSRLAGKVDADKNLSYRITRISAVNPRNSSQIFIDSIPAEDAVTEHELMEYLSDDSREKLR